MNMDISVHKYWCLRVIRGYPLLVSTALY